MSTSQKFEDVPEPPELSTPIITLHQLGEMAASRHKLKPGHYEIVVQYRFGPSRLADADGQFSAMAITFGGIGLRAVDEPSPMTIEVVEPAPDQSI